MTAWDDAVDTLAETSPAAVDLLTLLAFLAPEPFPPKLLTRYRRVLPPRLANLAEDGATLGKTITSLAENRFLTAAEHGTVLQPKPRQVLRTRLTVLEQSEWCVAALRLLRRAFPRNCEDARTWTTCRTLLPHLSATVKLAAELDPDSEAAAWLRDRGAAYLLSQGEYSEARDLVLPAARRVSKGRPTALAGTLLRTLGAASAALDDLDRAREELERALEIHLECLGPEHREIVSDRTVLARALGALEEEVAALEHLRIALDVDRQLDKPDLSSCGVRLVMGWTLLQSGDVRPAREMFEDCLRIAEEHFGAEHPAAATARTGLASVLQADGDHKGARDQLARALAISEHALGSSHPDVSVDRSNLGSVLHELGELDGARQELSRALDVARRTLPENHRTVWVRERKLASVLRSMDDLDGALEHGRRALAISRSALGSTDHRAAEDLSFIAGVLARQENHRGACDAYREALRIVEDTDEPDLREVAHLAGLAGHAARGAGDLGTARRHYETAVATYERIDDAPPANVIAARLALTRIVELLGDELAAGLASIGRDDRAAAIREESRDAFAKMFEAELEGDDPDHLYALAKACMEAGAWDGARTALARLEGLVDGDADTALELGMAWHALGRGRADVDRTFALNAYEKAVPLLGSATRLQGVALHDIAAIARDAGQRDRAIELFQQAADCKRRAATNDRDLVTTLHALARELEREPRLDEAEQTYREALGLLEELPVRELHFEGVILHDLADVVRNRDGNAAAIDLYRQAVERKRAAGEAADQRDLGMTLLRLGRALEETGRLDVALTVYKERLDLLGALPEPDLSLEAIGLNDIGDVLRAQGKVEEATRAFEASASRRRACGDEPDLLATTLMSLAEARIAAEEPELARVAAQEAADVLKTTGDPNPMVLANALTLISEVARQTDDPEGALAAVDEALALIQATDDYNPGDVATLQVLRARALKASERDADADAAREEAISALAKSIDIGTAFESIATQVTAAAVAYETEAWEFGIDIAEHALASADGVPIDDPTDHTDLLRYLGRARKETENYEAALEAFDELRRLTASQLGSDPQRDGVTVHDIANVKRAQGDLEAAVALYQEAAQLKRRAEPVRRRDLATTLIALGESALEAGQRETAREALEEALALTQARPQDETKRLAKIEGLLARATAEPVHEPTAS